MSKRLLTSLLLIIPLWLFAQSEKVLFSVPGGFYEESMQVSLESFYANHHIRYTTNGDSPTASSTLYTEPLTLSRELYSTSDIYTIINCIPSVYHPTDSVKHCIVIRAAVFDESDNCISEVATNSYFIRSLGCDTHGMPVLSIAADSLSLFDYETGIFIPGIHYDPNDSTHTGNFCETGREWERLVNMEFYEPDNSGVNQLCGLRIHGGASRWFQQKGMRLYAREEYGKKKFNHQFFESIAIDKFKHLNLHPFRCSNWLQTGGQEYLSQTVAATLNIDAMAVRQTVVFINGEYWGIYTLEESPDERYLESHYDVDPDQANLIKYWGVTQHGDGTDWWSFYSWINNADLSQPSDSAHAYSRMDVPSFIDYLLFEIYTSNLDWPQNNVMHWQAETGALFRQLFFDGDGCFTDPKFNAFEHATNVGNNSKMINHFLESAGFRNSMYQRYVELLNSAFSFPYLQSVMDTYRHTVEDEIVSQSERFGFPVSINQWNKDMDKASEFFRIRKDYFRQEVLTYLSSDEELKISFFCTPNPSTSAFNVIINTNGNTILPLDIYDALGQLVYSEEIYVYNSENVIFVPTHLSTGVYIVKIGDSIDRLVIVK